jgi:hypothetical protein
MRLIRRFIRLTRFILNLEEIVMTVSEALEALRAQVQKTTEIEASAVLLIRGLATQLSQMAQSNATPAQLQELANHLQLSSDALAAAVAQTLPVSTQDPPPPTLPADSQDPAASKDQSPPA